MVQLFARIERRERSTEETLEVCPICPSAHLPLHLAYNKHVLLQFIPRRYRPGFPPKHPKQVIAWKEYAGDILRSCIDVDATPTNCAVQ